MPDPAATRLPTDCDGGVNDGRVWDVAVIGAGPAGALSAILAARNGMRTLLIERKSMGESKVCGGCFNHRAVELLSRLGLGHTLASPSTVSIDQFRLRAWTRHADIEIPSMIAGCRAEFDQQLRQSAKLEGVTLQTETRALCRPSSAGLAQSSSEIPLQIIDTWPVNALPSAPPIRHFAKAVIAADGLGHPSLREIPEFQEAVNPRSRLGIGTRLQEAPLEYESGQLWMGVCRSGYVGAVRLADGTLNLAAAVSPQHLTLGGSRDRAIEELLARAGMPPVAIPNGTRWLGTPPLTRRTTPVAAGRIFAVGDAAGYIEPFTGEGIGNALDGAQLLAPCVEAAVHGDAEKARTVWTRLFRRRIWARQRACRLVSALTRHPLLGSFSTRCLNHFPLIASPFLRSGIAASLPRSH